jgi:hypothetical protein
VKGEAFNPNEVSNKISVSDDNRYTFSFDPSAYVIQSINLFPTYGTLADISIDYRIGNGELVNLIGSDGSWDLVPELGYAFEYNSSILNTLGLFDESVTELQISFTPKATGREDEGTGVPLDSNTDGNAIVGNIKFGGSLREVEESQPARLFAAAAASTEQSNELEFWYHSTGEGVFEVNTQPGPPAPAAAPEPATLLIFGCGMVGAGIAAYRRRKK